MLWFDRGGLEASQYQGLADALGIRRPRVLAWAKTDDGIVVGLPDRLAILRGSTWTSVAWSEVVNGGWDQRRALLHWQCDDRSGEVQLEDPRELPGLFRERVQSSIVVSRDVEVPGLPKPAIVSARRDPAARKKEIVWRIEPSDHMDPEVRARLAATLASVKDSFDLR